MTTKFQSIFSRFQIFLDKSAHLRFAYTAHAPTAPALGPAHKPSKMSSHLTVENCLLIAGFSLIILVSLAGNLLVVRALISQARLRNNSTNVLIGMLAVSDLIMTTFNIPFTLVDIILNDWIFGPFFCTLVSFVQANSVYVSSFTMAVIAINRWRVVYRFRPRAASCVSVPTPNNLRSLSVSTATGNGTQLGQNVPQQQQVSLAQPGGGKQSLTCWCWCRRSPSLSQTVEIEMAPVVSTQQPSPAGTGNGTFGTALSLSPTIKLSTGVRLALVIFAIWLLAAAHSLPHTVFNRVVTYHRPPPTPSPPSEYSLFSTASANDNLNTNDNAFILPSTPSPHPLANQTIRRCVPVFPQFFGTKIELPLTIFTSVTQYFIPLSMAMAIYTRIGATILGQGKVGEMTRGRVEQFSKKKRRRILMLVLIVAVFALCWLPFNVYYLLLDFGILKQSNQSVFMVCLWLAMSSVCYNPLCLLVFNESFQKEAKAVGQRFKNCLGIR